MYIQSVSLNACCLAVELGWSDVHTECIFKCRPACKKYNLALPRQKFWNLIILHALERQTERVSCFMSHTACGRCVCVCDVFCWTNSIRLPHCYIVTWFTLYGNVNSHCNKCFCYENPQVVHTLLSHALNSGDWCTPRCSQIRGSCFFHKEWILTPTFR